MSESERKLLEMFSTKSYKTQILTFQMRQHRNKKKDNLPEALYHGLLCTPYRGKLSSQVMKKSI